jgi:hypothetical protein
VTAGANIFGGQDPHTFFNQLQDASNAYVRARRTIDTLGATSWRVKREAICSRCAAGSPPNNCV